MPATYAVEMWAKRSSPPRAGAAAASSSNLPVPFTLISRASASGSVNDTEAALWTIVVTRSKTEP